MKIRRLSDGVIFEVREYVNGFGEESVWCDDWYGHHLVGRDCEFVDTYTAEEMEAFAEWCAVNNWEYHQFIKTWFNTKAQSSKTSKDLRELWEQERMAK